MTVLVISQRGCADFHIVIRQLFFPARIGFFFLLFFFLLIWAKLCKVHLRVLSSLCLVGNEGLLYNWGTMALTGANPTTILLCSQKLLHLYNTPLDQNLNTCLIMCRLHNITPTIIICNGQLHPKESLQNSEWYSTEPHASYSYCMARALVWDQPSLEVTPSCFHMNIPWPGWTQPASRLNEKQRKQIPPSMQMRWMKESPSLPCWDIVFWQLQPVFSGFRTNQRL